MDILVVEDHKEIGEVLCDFLGAKGYDVTHVTNGEEALACFETIQPKLIILDIMLPGIDGFRVCQKIREDYGTPIIIVSARGDKEYQLNGIMLGADDYIEKPYDIDILMAKVDGIFKRRYNSQLVVEGDLKLDKIKRIVYKNNLPLTLSLKEFELLQLLVENKNKVLKKEWLFNQIWGIDSFSEPQTLTVHIKWLREKIEDDPKKPQRIVTVWGIGYRFE